MPRLGNVRETQSFLASPAASDVRTALAAKDAIREVCGISAADILRRCAEIRASRLHGTAHARPPALLIGQNANRSWSLVELGDGSREAFIEAVYLALFGRQPDAKEVSTRLAQMRAGRTRLGIVLRLALSPEGSRAQQPRARGSGLQMVLRCARGLFALAQLPGQLLVVRTVRR